MKSTPVLTALTTAPRPPRQVDTRWTVETPEGVDFQFELAGPGKRGLARVIDVLLIITVIAAVALAAGILGMAGLGVDGLSLAVILITLFVLFWLYPALFEWLTGGRTPGKMVLNLRVVRTNGTPIGFLEAFGRSLLLAADVLPGPGTVALLSMTCTERLQRLGDVFFDTMVIDEGTGVAARQTIIDRRLPPLARACCSRSFQLPTRTLTAIERLFERSRPISPMRREELALRLANPIAHVLGYRPELDDHALLLPREPVGERPPMAFPSTLFVLRAYVTFSPDIEFGNPVNKPDVNGERSRPGDVPVELAEEIVELDANELKEGS